MLTNKLLYDNILQKYQEKNNNVLESRKMRHQNLQDAINAALKTVSVCIEKSGKF